MLVRISSSTWINSAHINMVKFVTKSEGMKSYNVIVYTNTDSFLRRFKIRQDAIKFITKIQNATRKDQ